MKTSVTKIMMSFALMGCLIFSASDAMAQGRSRSQGGSTSSRSQSAAVSSPNKSTAPTVTRSSSSSSSNMSRSAATPQVSRSTSGSTTTSRRSDATPQVSRSTGSSTSSNVSRRSDATPQVNRSTSGSTTSRSTSAPSSVTHNDNSRTTTIGTSGTSSRSGNGSVISGTKTRGGSTSIGKGGTTSSSHSSTVDVTRRSDSGTHITTTPEASRDRGTSITQRVTTDKGNGGGKPDKGGKPDNGGNGHGGNGHGNGHGHGNGYNPNNRYDYHGHHYGNEFSWNHSHHNWSRPLPPPARPYRLSPWAWYRPVIPVGWHPYSGAPIIDRILGLVFGTYYEVSLDQLYCDGYYINGYADGVIYLRDVPMLNLYWPDVMLNYEYNRLVNAQFIYHSNYYDTSRYNRVYRSLSRIYGTPVYRDGMTISWYGGDSRGYVTLSMVNDINGYYTTMSIGY